ncbi:MAG TPA: hypothetical protein VMG10_32240, partial [Gemmataceae bacterium]|nr:hypothetical protein [Gemmataceae bacterium]
PSSDAAFKGKVLLVNTNNLMMGVFILEKAQVQKIGDHSFLMGKGAADSRMGGWYKSRTVRLQMEHIVSITEFDDLKDAKKALESGGIMMNVGFGGYSAVPAVVPADGTPTPPLPATAPPPPPPAKQP